MRHCKTQAYEYNNCQNGAGRLCKVSNNASSRVMPTMCLAMSPAAGNTMPLRFSQSF